MTELKERKEQGKLKSRAQNLQERIKEADEKNNFSIFLGTGLYLIIAGLSINLLVSILISLPIILLYPYVLPILLLLMKISGWVLVAFGIITLSYPLMNKRISDDSRARKPLTILLKISTILTIILVPIGIFLGLGLKEELNGRNLDLKNPKEKEEKKGRKGKSKDEKTMAGLYFTMMFMAGIIHVLIGIVLIYVLPSVISGQMDLIYPYLTDELINFLTMLGWISLVPGAVLLGCAFFSKKFSEIESIQGQGIGLKIVRNLIIGSSTFLLLVFPIGTFFGLTLIQEFHSFKKEGSSN